MATLRTAASRLRVRAHGGVLLVYARTGRAAEAAPAARAAPLHEVDALAFVRRAAGRPRGRAAAAATGGENAAAAGAAAAPQQAERQRSATLLGDLGAFMNSRAADGLMSGIVLACSVLWAASTLGNALGGLGVTAAAVLGDKLGASGVEAATVLGDKLGASGTAAAEVLAGTLATNSVAAAEAHGSRVQSGISGAGGMSAVGMVVGGAAAGAAAAAAGGRIR